MLIVPQSSPYHMIFVEIDPFDELGAPDDPTYLRVSMTFSATRHYDPTALPVIPFQPSVWQTNTASDPPRHYAACPVGAQTPVGILAVGVWWPFAQVEANPETVLLAGEPFRID